MNKIFKVIWSKSKQCYVVVSEMAKNTTGKKKIIVGAILAGLATQGCSVMAAPVPQGNNSWGATTPGGVALGKDSVASGATAVDPATGVTRVAPSIAIGLASTSAGLDTITIGIGAGNSKSYGISMGKQTNVGGDYGIAIGYQTSAMSDHAVAIGEQTRAPKMGATVMGVSARGYGQGSVSLGWQALAGADVYGSGINIQSNPYTDSSTDITNYQKWGDTAIGLRAVATGGNATALGRSARAAAENAIAIGGGNGNNFNNNTEKTEATAEKAVAVGYNANASARDTLALGTSSKASGGDAVAIGTSSQATGGDSIALGKNAKASDGDSIAIGQDTESNKINSVALGKTSKATGASATALGPQAKATGSTAVAIGLNSEANQSDTVAIGQSSAASGLQAIAVGYKSAASGENAAAYGNIAKAVEKNSLALGANTQANVKGGVALGAGSIANTVAGAGYNPNTGRTNIYTPTLSNAMTSTWAAVSIGDGTNTRQLTGLAAGTNDTDAVNVAQLKSMNLAFTADGSTKGDVNLTNTNSALNVVGDSTYITTKGNNQTLTISGKKQIITVTDGTASASAGMADANNVAQAINQANAAQTISYKANGGTANTAKVSDGLNFTNGASTVATVGANGQVTYDLNTATQQSITDSSTAVNRTIALGGSTGSTTAKKLASGDVKFNIKGQTGTNALISTSASGDDVTIAPTAKLTAAVTAAENAADKNLSNISTSGKTVIKDLAKGAAQDAVKVAGTGLATVSDNTTGGVKTYTVDVNTGNLVVTANGQVGAAGTTGASGATGSNGVATTQNVATAINDAVTKAKASTTQALADAEHKFDGDIGATSVRKHGEVLSIKGGVTTPADLSTGNIGVVSDGAGTLNIRLAKVLSGLTSATFTDGSGNTQIVTGTSSTITDGAGHTTAMTKGGLSTTDGTNTTTVAPAGVTATDGTNTVKLNGSGIDAGNTQIKNVGKATTDDAAVNKKQMDDAVKAATDATTALGNNTIALGGDTGSTTAKKLSTNAITFNIKGDTGTNALITTSATDDDVTIAPTAKLTAAVTAAENSADKDLSNISSAGKTVIKDLAVTSAQDAVNVTGTGLATVSDNTTGGVKTYTVDVKAGNLVVDGNGQVGAAGATGAGGAVGTDGVATTQNVATAINDAITKSNANTAQALADAEHKFDGDTGATSVRKHGEVLSIKGGVTNSADLVAGNIGVVSDGAGTLNIRLAKVLNGLTSATFTDAAGNTQIVTGTSSTISDGAGNTTTMTKGGLSTTDGTNTTTVAPTGVTATDGTNTVKLNGSGIDAGNTQIKNVAKATTDDAAVNKKQMDDAVKAASDATTALGNNTITLGGNTGSTNAQKLNTSGGIQFNINGESGANALITTTASGNSVSIASTAKLSNAVAAAENAANKDLSNLSANGESRIKDLAKSAASWNVQTNGGATTAVSGGDTINFVDGKNITITNTGREITVATKDDVTFNKITVGGMTLDNNGMDAGNKEIKNVAAGTTANSAVNKQQLDNAISGVSNINYTTSSTTDRAGSTPVRSVSLSTGFDFKGDGNIQVTQDTANNGVIHYAMNPNLSGITAITGAGNGAPTMTFNSQNGNTPANVSINSNLDMGGHRITGVGPAEKPTDAVNKQQVDQALRGLTGMADNAARQYASKAGANAAALAALKPIQYDPLEPTQIMAGVGNYKSQTAVALGMAHYTNENTMFNIGVSLDSHDNMVNAGVTHKFGYSSEKKAIPDRYKGGPISSIYVMQDEMQALLAKDQEKDAVISKQASEIDTLRQQNEDMQRKIDMILAKLQ